MIIFLLESFFDNSCPKIFKNVLIDSLLKFSLLQYFVLQLRLVDETITRTRGLTKKNKAFFCNFEPFVRFFHKLKFFY